MLLCSGGVFGPYLNPGNEKCLESKRVPVTYYTCDEYRRSDGICLRQSAQTRMDEQCVRWQCKPGYATDKSGECVKPKA
jgi:hypothetical protein